MTQSWPDAGVPFGSGSRCRGLLTTAVADSCRTQRQTRISRLEKECLLDVHLHYEGQRHLRVLVDQGLDQATVPVIDIVEKVR